MVWGLVLRARGSSLKLHCEALIAGYLAFRIFCRRLCTFLGSAADTGLRFQVP